MMTLEDVTDDDAEVIMDYRGDFNNTVWVTENNLMAAHLVAVAAIDKMIRSVTNGKGN